ncbi:hypothetical protein AL036_02440 [Salipiger aestuarii]|nr:hypothetical protein C357_15606 [Citreicella sp. 357]KAA8609960.1 hypothetical protein AL036_02440 [Salipiger aestuarii]KAA8616284.1 hypothetical protein AL037_01655 [Salipiger aestuarii]KAB2543220.1 hypothetical protein AL035_03555 [Salipiger aestuarii]
MTSAALVAALSTSAAFAQEPVAVVTVDDPYAVTSNGVEIPTDALAALGGAAVLIAVLASSDGDDSSSDSPGTTSSTGTAN